MACPKCGCKVTYPFGNSDIFERCAHCGNIFDDELEGADEDDRTWDDDNGLG